MDLHTPTAPRRAFEFTRELPRPLVRLQHALRHNIDSNSARADVCEHRSEGLAWVFMHVCDLVHAYGLHLAEIVARDQGAQEGLPTGSEHIGMFCVSLSARRRRTGKKKAAPSFADRSFGHTSRWPAPQSVA